MQRGKVAHKRAVHFLRKGRVSVIGAQAGLDVADGHLVIKRSQRTGESRGRVAVDEHQIGPGGLEHLVHTEQRARGNGRERLLLLHDVQVVITLEVENVHHGIEHFAVLPGQAADALEILAGSQLQNERRHLDCLRPRAKDGHDLNLFHSDPPNPPCVSVHPCAGGRK